MFEWFVFLTICEFGNGITAEVNFLCRTEYNQFLNLLPNEKTKVRHRLNAYLTCETEEISACNTVQANKFVSTPATAAENASKTA